MGTTLRRGVQRREEDRCGHHRTDRPFAACSLDPGGRCRPVTSRVGRHGVRRCPGPYSTACCHRPAGRRGLLDRDGLDQGRQLSIPAADFGVRGSHGLRTACWWRSSISSGGQHRRFYLQVVRHSIAARSINHGVGLMPKRGKKGCGCDTGGGRQRRSGGCRGSPCQIHGLDGKWRDA